MPQKSKTSRIPKKSSPKRGSPVKTEDVSLDVKKNIRSKPGFPIVGIGAPTEELEALRESEERNRLFQGILRSTSDGILAVNRENEVLFANERFVEMWMIPQEVMATEDDTRLLEFVLEQLSDPQGFLRKVQELYGSAQDSFDTLYFKDGRIFDRLSRPMLHGTELQGRVWSFRDVTERKRAEDMLMADRDLLITLIDNLPDNIFIKDVNGRIVLDNNAHQQILGANTPEQVVGKTDFDFFPKELAARYDADEKQIVESGESLINQVEPVIDKDNNQRWLLTTKVPLRDRQGIITGIVGINRDITERKRAEQMLLQAEENYRNLFDNSLNGIFRSTPEGRFIMVNLALARIWAYDSPEDLLASVADTAHQVYVDPDGRAKHTRQLKEQGGIVTGFEYQAFRKDGSIVWVSENVRSIVDADGTLLYYEGNVEDISARKQVEEELRRAKDALENINLELQESLEREKLLASTDGLTGLYNHRHIFDLAAHEFQTAVRYSHSLTFLMFDLDNFKQVNDTLGHTIGDKLLQMVAQTTVAHVRASDVVARYGGDEFIILLPHTSAQQALPVAERIRASVAALRLQDDKEPLAFTLSIGIAETQHEPVDENAERVIQRADDALYKAKHNGRNCTVIFGLDETGAS